IQSRPFALRVGKPEAGERAVGAAIQRAAVLDGLERLSGGALREDDRGKRQKRCNSFHETAFQHNSVTALPCGSPTRRAPAESQSAHGLIEAYRSPQGPSPCASSQNERVARSRG